MTPGRDARVVGWGRGLLAGIGAGLVAGVACVLLARVTHTRIPPVQPSFDSAFVGGILGGLAFAVWSRVVGRPVMALWVTTLVLATAVSVMIATLPFPAARVQLPIPIPGLLVPFQQLGALIGLGRFGTARFPAQFLPVTIGMHYVTAVAVSLLVPRWSGRRA
ncbi:MAG: hypothetical protein E6H02_01950 [Bacillati bacterium ANGP1]|uniref:Uncharacterized protein n=1 Tax=Candidatus Segetimicrobium genomatis TaxID=2569760 RepID=A0A537M566_9BACT|nr:MAG: hypothetical protein E6H02_01950 [Terrabacteria group bacterium ANGP1]